MTRVLKHVTKYGFVFYIYGNDHLPMHVHVMLGSASGEEVIINLSPLEIRQNYMKRKDAMRAFKLVKEHREELIGEWKKLDPRLNQF